MIKYKLTNQNLQTHNGFQWVIGVEQIIDNVGNALCTDQVFHFYDSPEEAAFYNPIHADIKNPICWEVDCDQVIHDGIKGGAKRMMLLKQVHFPAISIDKRVRIAIRCAKLVYRDKNWNIWADNWLSGKDRSEKAAAAADIKQIIKEELYAK